MVGVRKSESLPNNITNDEIHYAARHKYELEPQQGQSKPASSNKSISGRAVARTAEYLPLDLEPMVVPSASLKARISSLFVGNNEDNCEDNLREDGSQPRAGFRRASWRGVFPALLFKLFMLLPFPHFPHTDIR